MSSMFIVNNNYSCSIHVFLYLKSFVVFLCVCFSGSLFASQCLLLYVSTEKLLQAFRVFVISRYQFQ